MFIGGSEEILKTSGGPGLPPGNSWQYLHTFLVVITCGERTWHLESRGAAKYPAVRKHTPPHNKKLAQDDHRIWVTR